ncbi:MAG: HD domain-containing protein, partial [Acidimicrobiales bacterium]
MEQGSRSAGTAAGRAAGPGDLPTFDGPRGRAMSEFSPEYMAYLQEYVTRDLDEVPARILGQLRLLEPIVEGMEVNQLQHSLQTASMADRAGASLDVVVAALTHDLGKTISNE